MADFVKWIEGKKYMWDGKIYALESEALETASRYAKNNFNVREMPEGGKHLVYTRRESATTAPGEEG